MTLRQANNNKQVEQGPVHSVHTLDSLFVSGVTQRLFKCHILHVSK